MVTLSDVADDVLVRRLLEIRKEERSLLVELLRYLAELDRRKAVLAMGAGSRCGANRGAGQGAGGGAEAAGGAPRPVAQASNSPQ